jgi:DNA polymerase III subunit delta'
MAAESVAPVFGDLIGQDEAVSTLMSAVEAAEAIVRGSAPTPGGPMTHAWLFTGPPGSGRSVAARAFAAALECNRGGCGECPECHTALAGTHADVRSVVPEGLSIPVGEMRELVLRAASAPTGSPKRPPTRCSRRLRSPPREPSSCYARHRPTPTTFR